MKIGIFLILISVLFFSCGQSPLEEGDAAMQSGEYGQALRSYDEALKASPGDDAIKEKIARAYFMSGEKIYKMRKVLPALEARIERGMEALPENISPEMKEYTVSIQLLMAEAYMSAPPENEYQKKEYFDKALLYLEKAAAMDPENENAAQKLAGFKQEHFDSMLKKGAHYFSRGKSDAINYLTAEYYLAKAADFNPEDAKAKDLLRTVRKKTLNVLDPTQNFPLAITAELYQDGYQAKQIVVQNLSGEALEIGADLFFMIDAEGNEVRGVVTEIFADPLQKQSMKDRSEIAGVVAFKAAKSARFAKIELRKDGAILSVKYLP